MFVFLNWGRSRRASLATLSIDPDDPAVQPALRFYVGRRWQMDFELYVRILEAVRQVSRGRIDDLSLADGGRVLEPGGAERSQETIKETVANRIRNSDIVFVPSGLANADRAEEEAWIRFETEAAAQSGRPVVFITENVQRDRLSGELALMEAHQAPARTSSLDARDLAWSTRVVLTALAP